MPAHMSTHALTTLLPNWFATVACLMLMAAVPFTSLAGPLAAAESHLTAGPEGDLVWYRMKLQEYPLYHKKKGDLGMDVQVVGAQACVVAFRHRSIIPVIEEKGVTLQVSDSGLSGRQIVRIGRNESPLEISVERKGNELSGTWSVLHSQGVKDDGKKLNGRNLSGAVIGEVITADHLKKNNAFAAKASWDSYQGHEQNFSASKTGVALVDSLSQARRVWTSPFIFLLKPLAWILPLNLDVLWISFMNIPRNLLKSLSLS